MNKKRLKKALLKRDGPLCRWPGCNEETDLTLHHFIPQALGGSSTLNNLCLLCEFHHVLVHRFLHIPEPGQKRQIKPRYLAAWKAMYGASGR